MFLVDFGEGCASSLVSLLKNCMQRVVVVGVIVCLWTDPSQLQTTASSAFRGFELPEKCAAALVRYTRRLVGTVGVWMMDA